MSRSLKKMPYVEEKLFNRICAMNDGKAKKEIVKTCVHPPGRELRPGTFVRRRSLP